MNFDSSEPCMLAPTPFGAAGVHLWNWHQGMKMVPIPQMDVSGAKGVKS